jgi:hypothetical protein
MPCHLKLVAPFLRYEVGVSKIRVPSTGTLMNHPDQNFTIDTNFPGSNIVIEKIEGDDVFLHQDLRDTQGDWFYWAFRVRGAAGRRLAFHFTGSDVLGVRGAALSHDEGATWQWLGEESVARGEKVSFSYSFPAAADEVLLAFCPLYTQRELDRFLARRSTPALQRSVLCRSAQGREVELLRLENPAARFNLLLTARHHACETMGSFCLEGILEAALGEDELGAWLRANVNLAAVPFMDKDGVEAGDQGKNRKPYDHNRDYAGAISDSIYPEVRALRAWAPTWFDARQTGFLLDLHCPWIRGKHDEEAYFVGGPDEAIWQRVQKFSSALESERRGVLPFRSDHNLPFGCGWNTIGGDAVGQRNCARWASELPGIHFAVTMEVPYANAGGAEVTPQNCRALGHDLASALRHYILSFS